jgi:hypothetical protein
MTTAVTRTAKRLRAKTLIALACVLVAAGAAFAASSTRKPDFKIVTSPSSKTVNRGQVAKYNVTIKRLNGFKGQMSLSTSRLPAGAKAIWKLSDGRTLPHPRSKAARVNLSVSVLPKGKYSAVLWITTASSTPLSTSNPVIKAVGGGKSHTKSVKLTVQSVTVVTNNGGGGGGGTVTGSGGTPTGTGTTVQPAPPAPTLTVAASPPQQNVLQGDVTSFTFDVSRSNFSDPVDMSVSGLPSGVHVDSWNPGSTVTGSSVTLNLSTDPGAATGTYNFTVTGTRSGGGVTDSAVATLVVQQTKSFDISGNLGSSLTPGASVPLDLTLNNPYNFDLKVTSLNVAIQEPATADGCTRADNYTAHQFGGSYPITLPPGSSTLSSLGISTADLPHIEMVETGTNQDVCKGAPLNFDYTGSAGK